MLANDSINSKINQLMAIKKTTAKKAVKKAAKKKVPTKKTVAKKAPVKKAAKKAPAKKAAKKKVVAKKVQQTSIIANVDVGFGNSLYIRGEGAGLSWDRGIQMENVSPYEWQYTASVADGSITFKFLINDEAWAEGENLTVSAGGKSVSTPTFNW